VAAISPNVSSEPQNGNGTQAEFPFNFSIVAATDVGVYVDGVRKTYSTHYSVTFGATSGTVTFTTPPVSGTRIQLISEPDYLQTSEFADQGAYNLSTVNMINRRAAIRDLVNHDLGTRALKVPLGDPAPALPPVSELAGKVLGHNGTQFIAVPNDATSVAEAVLESQAARNIALAAAKQTTLDLAGTTLAVAALPARYTKSASTTITADASLNIDADLSLPLAANTLTRINGKIYFTTTAAADFKWRHIGPVAPTRVRVQHYSIAPGDTALSNIAVDTTFSAADISVTGAAGSGWIEIDALIANGSNVGNFGISWSQNTSDTGNTTVEAGSYLEAVRLPVTLDVAFGDSAVAKLGGFAAPVASSGHNVVGVPGLGMGLGNCYLDTVIHGTDLSAQLFGGNYTLQIDGGTPTTIIAPPGWSFVPLFHLPEGNHRIKLRGQYFDYDLCYRISGSAPQITRPSDVPNFYPVGTIPYSDYIAAEGVTGSASLYAAGNEQRYWSQPSGSGLRFAATTTSVRLWMFNGFGTGAIVLLQDGVEIASVTPAISSNYEVVALATGLSGTHEYEVKFISVSTAIYVNAVLVDTLSASVHTPKQVDAYFGDSIVQGNALISQTDSRVMDPYILAQATGRVSIRRGGSGAKVSTGLRDTTSQITGLSSIPSRVFCTGGVNDMITGVPITTFRSDYQTMLSLIRAGLPSAKIYARGILSVGTSVANYAQRNAYNGAILAAVTAIGDTNIIFVNTDGWIDPATDTSDGLHPNASGYAKMAAAQQIAL
jgi:lysophospholipase L1-like esterase